MTGLGALVAVLAFIVGCTALREWWRELKALDEQIRFEQGDEYEGCEYEGHDGFIW